MQVHVVVGFVLDGDEGVAAGDGRPAVDRERHPALVPGLVPPLQNSEGRSHRERAVGILEAEDALLRVQLLVDVGVGLELEPLVGARGDADADERILLAAANLEHHRPLHLHPFDAAVLLERDVELLLNLEGDAVLGDGGRAPAALGNGAAARIHRHRSPRHILALRGERREKFVGAGGATLGAAELEPPRGTSLRLDRLLRAAAAGTHAHAAGPAPAEPADPVAELIRPHAEAIVVVARARSSSHAAARAHAAAAHAGDADAAHAVHASVPPAPRPFVNLGLVNLQRFAFHHVLGVVDLGLDDHLVEFLFVRLHLGECANLRHGDVLLVAEGDDLVEGEDEVEGGAADAFFVRLLLRVLRDDFTEQA